MKDSHHYVWFRQQKDEFLSVPKEKKIKLSQRLKLKRGGKDLRKTTDNPMYLNI